MTLYLFISKTNCVKIFNVSKRMTAKTKIPARQVRVPKD